MNKNYHISKLIHWIHVIGVASMIISLPLLWLTNVPVAFFATGFVINLCHPEAKCYITHMEEKYRKRAGLEPLGGWIKHYFIRGNIFRKD